MIAAALVALAALAAPAEAPPGAPPKTAARATAPAATAALRPFGFEDVRKVAQERAKREFRPAADTLPQTLANLTFEQYRDIRFRAASALWRGQSLFEVQFFHRGYHNRERVNLFEVSPEGVTPLTYNPAFYTYGALQKAPPAPANLGYAGFRVHYPLQTPAYKDELLSFLGASYFRVLGATSTMAHPRAGSRSTPASSRARSFRRSPISGWCAREPAIAGSPSTRCSTAGASVGAYQFEVRPGAITLRSRCTARCISRRAIAKLGIAPAHLDVSLRSRTPPAGASMTTARRCTTAMACMRRPARDSGCGARSPIRVSCA